MFTHFLNIFIHFNTFWNLNLLKTKMLILSVFGLREGSPVLPGGSRTTFGNSIFLSCAWTFSIVSASIGDFDLRDRVRCTEMKYFYQHGNTRFWVGSAIYWLFHYAHRVRHVFLTQFAPQNAQNEPVASRLKWFLSFVCGSLHVIPLGVAEAYVPRPQYAQNMYQNYMANTMEIVK